MTPPREYIVTPPIIPGRDLSGDIGPHLLQRLSRQAERRLRRRR